MIKPADTDDTSALAMPLAQFYSRLTAHDWFYSYSEDSGVFRRGADEFQMLSNIAKANGAVHGWLLAEMRKAVFSGDSGEALIPRPPAPVELGAGELDALLDDLHKHESAQQADDAVQSLNAAVSAVRYQGAYFGANELPAQIAGHPVLAGAWLEGKAAVATKGTRR